MASRTLNVNDTVRIGSEKIELTIKKIENGIATFSCKLEDGRTFGFVRCSGQSFDTGAHVVSVKVDGETVTLDGGTMNGTCGKCDGKGYINAFGHYANGVCFDCGGTGKLEVAVHIALVQELPAPKYTPEQVQRQRAWLQTCTAAQLARCSWPQIWEAHNLAVAMKIDGELSARQLRIVKDAIVGWTGD